jgi:hypothetical protein
MPCALVQFSGLDVSSPKGSLHFRVSKSRVVGEIAAKQNRSWPASQVPDAIVWPPLK